MSSFALANYTVGDCRAPRTNFLETASPQKKTRRDEKRNNIHFACYSSGGSTRSPAVTKARPKQNRQLFGSP
jgi:hypothetical protein